MGPGRPDGVDCSQFGTVSLLDASLYLGIALAVAVALSMWSFRRRDVP